MSENMTVCPDKEALVTYLYEEDEAPARRAIEAHVEQCAACRDEVSGLRRVRERLADWEAPALDVPMPVLGRPRPRQEPRPWIARPGFLAAAAALLVMGLAAGLANLEIRFGSDGVVIRTGWARSASPSTSASGSPAQAARPTTVPASTVAPGSAGAPWRADLVALEQQLRQEFQPGRAAAITPAAVSTTRSARGLDPETLRQIQALIDESEVRQQRNLALRVAEVSRDFDLQRKADLVQIQQGLGRLEGRTDAEAARTRELVNYMMRVSQQSPPR